MATVEGHVHVTKEEMDALCQCSFQGTPDEKNAQGTAILVRIRDEGCASCRTAWQRYMASHKCSPCPAEASNV